MSTEDQEPDYSEVEPTQEQHDEEHQPPNDDPECPFCIAAAYRQAQDRIAEGGLG